VFRFLNFVPAPVLLAGLLAVGDAWAAEAPAKPDHVTIRPDPAVRRGVLPNGLRYMIMRNASPKDAVSLRLTIDVGSYEEADTERGWAHFVEHMAFRSTRGFPDGAVDRVFAPLGVAFGRDQNATTTMFSTNYQLDMPKPDQAELKSGFDWLRDVADGIVFTDDAVAHERGVILAEMETRNNPLLMAQEAIGAFQAGGQRSVNRSPIGLRTTLDAATAAGLNRFHQTWYRPGHAMVAVVGDRSVEEMEALVKATFSSWTASGPPPTRAPLVQPGLERGVEAFNVSGASLPMALSACRLRSASPPGPDDVPRLQRLARSQIWQDVLNQRLVRLVNAGDSGLMSAGMMGNDARDFAASCLVAVPTGDAWSQALSAARDEMNAFAREGPTELEMEKAVELQRSRLRGAILGAGSRASPDLASALVSREVAGELFVAPDEALYAFDLAVEDLTIEDVKASFATDWSGGAPLLAMTSPKPLAREAILAAWTQNAAGPVTAHVADQAAATWAYASFGKPGKIVERRVVDNPGFTRLRFANGVLVNFKQQKIEPNKVEIRLHFGGGRGEIASGDYITAEFGGMLVVAGGLRRHSFVDLQGMFASEANWNFALGMGPQTFAMSNSTFVGNLGTQLALMAAYMSDPGFDSSLDARIPTSVDLIYRTLFTQPAVVANIAIVERVAPDSDSRTPPQAVMAGIRSADFERVLKPILTTAPIEVTIVGDLDEASAISLLSTTFGALPARPQATRPQGRARFLRYPETSPPPILAEHDGPIDKASAAIVWPLYVSTPERRQEEYALKLLASVFDTALRRRIREELGKTYAPSVQTTGPDFGDEGALQVSIDAAPRELEALIVEARAVAARLMAGEITPQMLEDARQPLMAAARARRETNAWWAGAMGGSAREPAVLEESLKYEALMSTLTVDDLKRAAARWLAREPIVGMAYPRATSTGAAK